MGDSYFCSSEFSCTDAVSQSWPWVFSAALFRTAAAHSLECRSAHMDTHMYVRLLIHMHVMYDGVFSYTYPQRLT